MEGKTSKANLTKIALLATAMLSITLICTLKFKIFNPSSVEYIGFLAIVLILLWLLVGFRPKKNFDGTAATQIVVIYVLLFLILIYVLGLVTGFLRNGYGMSPLMILKNSLPVMISIGFVEMIRYGMAKKIGENYWVLLGLMFVFSAMSIVLNFTIYDISQPYELYEMIGIVVLGGVATNVMLTFVAWKSDWRPTLTYSLIMSIYPIVLPILPDLGPFIYSVLAISLPTILLMRFNEFFVTKRPIPTRKKHHRLIFATIPTLTILTIVVILVSGIFRYWAMAIGSNSMAPNIKTGDVVIIDQKETNIDDLKKGEIIAFKNNGKIIAHRLIDIEQSSAGALIQTKGDNNNDNDAWIVKQEDLVGTVKWKIPFVGWPTIWLNDIFNR